MTLPVTQWNSFSLRAEGQPCCDKADVIVSKSAVVEPSEWRVKHYHNSVLEKPKVSEVTEPAYSVHLGNRSRSQQEPGKLRPSDCVILQGDFKEH